MEAFAMNDEFSPLDWYLRPNTWPRWTPDATLNGEHAPPKVPARIAFDWDETPTGGLIGRPNPLWSQSNSYWWESIPSAPPASGNGGLLGSLSAQTGMPPFEPDGFIPWLPAMPPVAATPPTKQPWDNPWTPDARAATWDSSKLQIPPSLPPVFPSAPRLEDLDSAKSWGAAPPAASGEPMAPSDYRLSSMVQAPTWDTVATRASAAAKQMVPERPRAKPGLGVNATAAPPGDEFGMAQDAFRDAAERMRRGVRRTAIALYAPPIPDPEADAGEPGLVERIRLNGVDSFYRGTLLGAGRLALMQHYASTPDEPQIDPQTRRWRDQLRKDYPQVIADLARYDRMRGFGNASELGAAALGQLGGGLPTPESLVGVGAKGASLLWRLLKAGLQQGAFSAAVDPIVQELNVKAGVQDEYDPVRTMAAGGLGIAMGAAAKSATEALSRSSARRSATTTNVGADDPRFHQKRADAHDELPALEPERRPLSSRNPDGPDENPPFRESEAKPAQTSMPPDATLEMTPRDNSLIGWPAQQPMVRIDEVPQPIVSLREFYRNRANSISRPKGEVFDFSHMHEVPPVPQYNLLRYEPRQGVPERFLAMEDPATIGRMNEYVRIGMQRGGHKAFNAEPFRQAFLAELGSEKGQATFDRLMDLHAAASQVSTDASMIRIATFYDWLARQGFPRPIPVLDSGKWVLTQPLPYPYGHFKQGLHAKKVNEIVEQGGLAPLTNKKIASIGQNFRGNWTPVAFDSQFTRPWFLTDTKGKRLDALPDSAYGFAEGIVQRQAPKFDLTPAQYQAAGREGAAELTGLRSRVPFLVELDRRLGITADYYGTTKAAILKRLIRHGFPLVSLGVTAGVGGRTQLPDQERVQEDGD
jgi:hypothetical protein